MTKPEDDMLEVTLRLPAAVNNETRRVILSWSETGRDRIKVWLNEDKSAAALGSPQEWALGQQPPKVWVEGIKEGDDVKDISMTLQLMQGQNELIADELPFTVGPVLQNFTVVPNALAAPGLLQRGEWWLSSKAHTGVHPAIEMYAAAWSRLLPGRLQFVQNVHTINHLAGNKGATFSNGDAAKYYDFKAPLTGEILLDTGPNPINQPPFYPQDSYKGGNVDTSILKASDSPEVPMTPVLPTANRDTTVDFSTFFEISVVWEFQDGTISSLGQTTWYVDFKGMMTHDPILGEPKFTGDPGNGVFSEGTFHRNNALPVVLKGPVANASNAHWY